MGFEGLPVHSLRGSHHSDAYRPTAALYETMSRDRAHTYLTALVSGDESFWAIALPAGLSVSGITFVSGNIVTGTPTNQYFVLRDNAYGKLAVTNDDTTTAWAAQTAKALSFATPFVTTYSGLHFIGAMVKATTVPNFYGAGNSSQAVDLLSPQLWGIDTTHTGLTTPATSPATLTPAAGTAGWSYGYVF